MKSPLWRVLSVLARTTECSDVMGVGAAAVFLELLEPTAYLLCSWMVPDARWPTRYRTALFCVKSSWQAWLRSASVAIDSATAACTRICGSLSAVVKAEQIPACTSFSTLSASQPSCPSARTAASCPSSVPSLRSLSSGGMPSSSMMSLAKCWLSRASEARLAAESARAARPPVCSRATWSQMRKSMGSFCAMLGSPRRSPSPSPSPSALPWGEEMRSSQATSSSAVSRSAAVRGNPAAGLSVKSLRSRGWPCAQRAASAEALARACAAPAMIRAAGRS
ncbi:hypothetical protein ACQ4PT_036248 [Festuca glaucescens]